MLRTRLRAALKEMDRSKLFSSFSLRKAAELSGVAEEFRWRNLDRSLFSQQVQNFRCNRARADMESAH
jgi:hypothetical protein